MTVTVEAAPQARMAAALRRVTIVRLDALRGPGSGILELPLTVCWSLPSTTFDLADRDQVRSAYRFVISAAREPAHLIPYLHADLLKDAWPDLGLPLRTRAAWEGLNPELRLAAAA